MKIRKSRKTEKKKLTHHCVVKFVGNKYILLDERTGKTKVIGRVPKHHSIKAHRRYFKKHIEGRYHKEVKKADLDKAFVKAERFAEEKAIPILKDDYRKASNFTKEKALPFIKKEAKEVGGFFKHLFAKKHDIKYGDSVPKVPESDKKIETSQGEFETY